MKQLTSSPIILQPQPLSFGKAITRRTETNDALFAPLLSSLIDADDALSAQVETFLLFTDEEVSELFASLLSSFEAWQKIDTDGRIEDDLQKRTNEEIDRLFRSDEEPHQSEEIGAMLLSVIQTFGQMKNVSTNKHPEHILHEEALRFKDVKEQLVRLMDKFSEHIRTNEPFRQALQQYESSNNDQMRNPLLKNVMAFLVKQVQKGQLQSTLHQSDRGLQHSDELLAREVMTRKVPIEVQERQSRFPGQVQVPLQQGAVDRIQQFEWHSQFRQTTDEPTLIKQVERMLATSRMSAFRNGITELTVRLQPEQLGSLAIKLVHEKGEVTARIIAQTDVARNLIESQIHQLRLAFLGQNINVEKIEVLHTEQTNSEAEERDEGKQDEQKNNEQMKRQHEQLRQENDEDDEASFHAWLHALTNERGVSNGKFFD